MLVIRDGQLDAFRDALRQKYYKKLLVKARAERPELSEEPDDQLLAVIERASVLAVAHGIFSKVHTARFVDFVLRYGVDFDTRPDMAWAVAILDDIRLVGPAKLDRLEAHAE